LNQEGSEKGLAAIARQWEQVYPDAVAFDSFFLDKKFAEQETDDRYFAQLFDYFTGLSLVISCLGLFGLSLLISTKRRKEVGIRKAFGASSNDIVSIFLRSYMGSLVLSLAIGSALAWFLMDSWLNNFAYRIEIGFGLLSLAFLSLTVIFIGTISFQTIRSSVANPVDVLKD
jgi:putative ABC transport system permease protein